MMSCVRYVRTVPKETLFHKRCCGISYTREIKQSMYRFKYDGQREYARFYAELLYKLKGHIIASWKPQVIIPVPLHAGRYRKRGYNQAALVAHRLGRLMNIPVDETLLVRTKIPCHRKL